ncbi:MAG TPA: DUF3276 family protein [Chitinophagaceae bacterium]|nr:DUF3276 family protein [Chitinophagaceae bacterium]
MAYENNQNFENNFENKTDEKRIVENIFSKRVRAGKRRTYFFDVRETRGKDYFITITESKRRFNDEGYDRHKLFIYKEDFNKFLEALSETVDYVKTELMPDFDFDAFNNRDEDDENSFNEDNEVENITSFDSENVKPFDSEESVDAWKI